MRVSDAHNLKLICEPRRSFLEQTHLSPGQRQPHLAATGPSSINTQYGTQIHHLVFNSHLL
jgi:hypothetical protein